MTRWLKVVIVCAASALIVLFALAAKGVLKTTTATSAFTFVALVLSLLSLGYQIWRTGLVQAADLLMQFEQNFFGKEKRDQRALAAQNYLRNSEDFKEMEDILDFFETVAMLTRKEALDLYMVWHTFDYWIERYYGIAKPYITLRQTTDPGVWSDLTWLLPKLIRLHEKSSKTKHASITPEEKTRFLTEEAQET